MSIWNRTDGHEIRVKEYRSGDLSNRRYSGYLSEGIMLRACRDLLDNAQNPIKFYAGYTKSALTWAISITPKSNIKSLKEIKKVAISRYGSGSHIIAVLLAKSNNIEFEYEVCNDILGMISALQSGSLDAFLWEIVTTQPYYDKGMVKLLDTISPKWPSFCMATTLDSVTTNHDLLQKFRIDLLKTIPRFVKDFHTTGIKYIMENKDVFHYEREEGLMEWFEKVEFVDDFQSIDKKALKVCLEVLIDANMLDREQIEQFKVDNNCADIVDLLIV